MKLLWTTVLPLIAAQLISCPDPSQTTPGKERKSMRLWYEYPAETWMTQGLPVGNGTLGAMFFGGYNREHVQFNEKTLWSGTPDQRGVYQNFGDIYIDIASHGTRVSDYRRELSISDAVGSVSYTAGGVSYRREYFSSFPDGVMVIRFTTPGSTGKLMLSVDMADSHSGGEKTVEERAIIIKGKLATVNYEARLVVVNEGGTVTADSDSKKLTVSNADAVTILLAAATNYDKTNNTYIGESATELSARLNEITGHASQKNYDGLKREHLSDYRPLFDRAALDLKENEPSIPTDELLRSRRDSNYLDMLYFQYGRYLMIASSRGMDVPNNLQGIWNDSNSPEWGSDIHTNINIQMNYWPAEITNLSECHLPFLNFIKTEALRPGGNWRGLAGGDGARGWTLATQSTIFGHSDWEMNRPANAWYSMHLWQHYAYTLDEGFLRDTAYPVMKSACEYWFDRLILAADGTWEAPNEFSPEQGNRENGVAHAQQLIWDLFHKTIKAVDILGGDASFAEELRAKFDKLDTGLRIGAWGNIREWKYDSNSSLETASNKHRHFSHLVGLYPGDQITACPEPEFAEAAKVSLDARGDDGTGWSRAWKVACWARLLDGNRARKLLKAALELTAVTETRYDGSGGGVYENLLDAHPPFQIDGNFGGTAGITEMLIQSHKGYIEVLPALPDEWSSGSFTGLKAQGNFSIDLSWENSRPVRCTVYSGSGGPCVIRCGGSSRTLQTSPGGKYSVSF